MLASLSCQNHSICTVSPCTLLPKFAATMQKIQVGNGQCVHDPSYHRGTQSQI